MISIVMASYNSEKYISQQIDSILNNISIEDELIICDDCSSDGTKDILLDYSRRYTNIKIIFNNSNIGVNNNFEKVLNYAKGDYIAISDDDDLWYDKKIDKSLFALKNEKIIMVVHDCIICDENLNIINKSYFTNRSTKTGLLRTIIKPGYRGATMCFRRELLKYLLPFPKKLNMFYDEWISLMAEKHGKVKMIREPLSVWRRRTDSVSTINVKKKSSPSNSIILLLRRVLHRLNKFKLILYR